MFICWARRSLNCISAGLRYHRFEKRHKNTAVHVSPAFRVKVGDEIMAGQCRPLSKTVRFNMLKVIRAQGGNKKGFTGM